MPNDIWKNLRIAYFFVGFGLLIALIFLIFQRSTEESATNNINIRKDMILQSLVFEDQGHIPQKYTCDADNISPPLKIISVPEHAESLVLIVEDPDAPAGTWTHWTVWNIDPKKEEIAEGVLPKGAVQGLNSSGEIGYSGPCPPSGVHRYFFKLFALDAKLQLETGATVEALQQMMEGHILTQAELVGLYSRQ